MSQSLVRQIVRLHAVLLALTCGVLVAGAIGATAVLLRHDQDTSLASLTTALGRSIDEEAREIGGDYGRAMAAVLEERELPGYAIDITDAEGRLIASSGQLAGWPAVPGEELGTAPRNRCITVRGQGSGSAYRACSQACGRERLIWVVTTDVLDTPGVEQAAMVLAVVLPLAVAGGALLGRAWLRRTLRPLGVLRDAALRLSAAPGLKLGVGARATELSQLEGAFDGLLQRMGEALERETRFSHEASHEIRTSLTALRGRLEEIRASAPPASAVDLDAALAEVGALDRLVEALLVLARSESAPVPKTPVNLCDVARDVATMERRAWGGGFRGSLEVEGPDEILVRGSEELLARAVGNLVENAHKFAGASARIRVGVSREEGCGVVRVEDDGPGVSDEHHPYLFERFFRAPAQRHDAAGTGLGLAVVRTVALRHGGRVECRKASLGGLEVRFQIPLLAPVAPPLYGARDTSTKG